LVCRVPALTFSARVPQVVELRDDDHESSRPSNCCRDFAPDFGASLRSASVTASVDLASPRCGEGEPWCRNSSVARASIRSQGLFGLSVWPGGQFPRIRIVRMATPITGSSRDQETSGNGIQSASALGQKRTHAVQQRMSAMGHKPTWHR